MSKTLKGKNAIITGSSRGIGAAIAKRLAGEGACVTINFVESQKEADLVVSSITQSGGKAIAIRADVSKATDMKRLFDETEKAFGGVDILINNAGVVQPGVTTLMETDDALFDRIISTNLRGTFNGLRESARRLRKGGRVVNFSSSVTVMRPAGYPVYAASKAAIEVMTSIFAKEMKGKGINVNAVAPGPMSTELFMEGKDSAAVENIASSTPLERLGEPEDIAKVVAFLVGEEGAWVDGQTLRANGGII